MYAPFRLETPLLSPLERADPRAEMARTSLFGFVTRWSAGSPRSPADRRSNAVKQGPVVACAPHVTAQSQNPALWLHLADAARVGPSGPKVRPEERSSVTARHVHQWRPIVSFFRRRKRLLTEWCPVCDEYRTLPLAWAESESKIRMESAYLSLVKPDPPMTPSPVDKAKSTP